MADTVEFELVSPERLLLSVPVEMVVVPGSEGDFGVLPGHAPMISTVRPGVISIWRDGAVDRRVCKRGFGDVLSRDEHRPAGLRRLDRRRENAGHRPQLAAQRKLPVEFGAAGRFARHLPARQQDAERDRQIEPAAALAHVRRAQADRDAALGKLEP